MKNSKGSRGRGKGRGNTGLHVKDVRPTRKIEEEAKPVDVAKITTADLSPTPNLTDVANVLKEGGSLAGVSPYLQKKSQEDFDKAEVFSTEAGQEILDRVLASVSLYAQLITQVALPDRITINAEAGACEVLRNLYNELKDIEILLGGEFLLNSLNAAGDSAYYGEGKDKEKGEDKNEDKNEDKSEDEVNSDA